MTTPHEPTIDPQTTVEHEYAAIDAHITDPEFATRMDSRETRHAEYRARLARAEIAGKGADTVAGSLWPDSYSLDVAALFADIKDTQMVHRAVMYDAIAVNRSLRTVAMSAACVWCDWKTGLPEPKPIPKTKEEAEQALDHLFDKEAQRAEAQADYARSQELVRAHQLICPKHPMRQAEKLAVAYRALLVAYVVRVLDCCGADYVDLLAVGQSTLPIELERALRPALGDAYHRFNDGKPAIEPELIDLVIAAEEKRPLDN